MGTGHMEDNCVQLNNKITCELQIQEQMTAAKATSKRVLGLTVQEIIAPQNLDQSEGDKVCAPDWIDNSNMNKRIMGLIEVISSQNVSAEVTFEVMQRAVATCPKVNMGFERKRISSLLDSGSQVALICQNYLSRRAYPY